jgi:hypothetical protein
MSTATRTQRSKTVLLVLAFAATLLLGSVGGATAAAKINGKNIKPGSIPLSALSKDAQTKLKGAQGPAGPAGAPGAAGAAGAAGAPGASAAKYWAYVTETGSVGRSSGNITASYISNGGMNKLYTVRFPTDITQCGYSVTSGDTDPINQSMSIDALVPAVSRSAVDNNTLAVSQWLRNTQNGQYVVGNLGQGSFYIAVFC